ncbi:thioredoxin domain-containing protein [Streptomyces sp. ST2-7A]|uniref:thioredoxin domain-containing protein n=1 Tax=Streptomyces sp. ST2-7A TaxID=2907214 RepID=UPI001F340C81|nr:thioredoxin domain-containing protein [Streptomyces sp. ST2-7A]MCE7082996.1 thioredoxin domain-containing protein [Streptomyces sp. ST2-7A]
MANRLAEESSPYLLQHADNPVDWWPWSPGAFEEARRRDAPVLLSVGYASCHWCHVMARESFADPDVAAYLNERFVAIKVDREERPDVDSVYMDAVQAATGQGGWPMTVFMTAEGEPFYFGTYFPPEPRHGLPSFRQLLEGVHTAWTDRREEVGGVAGRIARDLAGREGVRDFPDPPGPAEQAAALLQLSREFDMARGGFGGAPKFPPSMVLEFLLRHHARTGAAGALGMARRTCDAMARGGIHDQLGGGFARYSVDAEWTVPHFEKMLYDNALLCRVYTHLWRADGTPRDRRVALDTADFMIRDLRTAEGGFASALDADSADPADPDGPHIEGAHYVWTPAEVREALEGLDEATVNAALDLLGVTEEGTFEEGRSVLRLPPPAGPAGGTGASGDPTDPGRAAAGEDDPAAALPAEVRRRLLAARDRRPRPERDDKVVAAWNGLAIAALAEAGICFDRPDLVEAAEGAADLIVGRHLDADGRLTRTSLGGEPGRSAGVLEDYADVAEGFHALYAATGEVAWLDLAGVLLEVVLTRFRDADGSLYDTADDAERLIRRPQDPTDGAAPSGWTAAAGALLTHAAHTGDARYREAAERALGIVSALAPRAPRFAGWGLAVAEAALDGPREVAVVGPPGDPLRTELHRVALRSTAPGAVVALGEPDGADTDTAPLLRDRPLREGLATAYVCRNFVCSAPTTDPAELAERLRPDGTP